MADQGGNCAGVGGWGYELSFFNGISVGMSEYCGIFFFCWERMLFVRLLRTISRLVVMTGALFEDCC